MRRRGLDTSLDRSAATLIGRGAVMVMALLLPAGIFVFACCGPPAPEAPGSPAPSGSCPAPPSAPSSICNNNGCVRWIEPGTGSTNETYPHACVGPGGTYVAFEHRTKDPNSPDPDHTNAAESEATIYCGPPLLCSPDPCDITKKPGDAGAGGGPQACARALNINMPADNRAVLVHLDPELTRGLADHAAGSTWICLGGADDCSTPGRGLIVHWRMDGACP